MSAGWAEGLERLKEQMATAVDEASLSVDVRVCGFGAPDSEASRTRSYGRNALSGVETGAPRAAVVSDAGNKENPTSSETWQSPTPSHEAEKAISAIDSGSQQHISTGAQRSTETEQRHSELRSGGEWIWVDVHANEEDGWSGV